MSEIPKITPNHDSNDEIYGHEETRLLGSHIQEFFELNESINGTPEQRRQFFADMSPDDFIEFVAISGGLVRGQEAGSEAVFDGTYTKALAGNSVPNAEDKREVLSEFWSLAREYLNDETIENPNEALGYACVLAQNAVVLTHPFVDTNGRTSRLVSYAIFNGAPTNETWEDTLSRSGGVGKDDTAWDFGTYYTFKKHGKDDFVSELQPQKIDYDYTKSKEHGFRVREYSIRAVIDNFQENTVVTNALEDNYRVEEDGSTILDGDRFLWDIVTTDGGVSVEEIQRVINKDETAGNFLRAMKTDSPYCFGDKNSKYLEPDETYITPESLMRDGLDETLHEMYERQRSLMRYFVPEIDFSNTESIRQAISNLPLRKQLLIERAGAIKDFSRIYDTGS